MTLRKTWIIAGLIAASAGLSGCGLQGHREPAPPIWGDKAKGDGDAQKKPDGDKKPDDQKTPERAVTNGWKDPYAPSKPVPETQTTTMKDDPLKGMPDPTAASTPQ